MLAMRAVRPIQRPISRQLPAEPGAELPLQAWSIARGESGVNQEQVGAVSIAGGRKARWVGGWWVTSRKTCRPRRHFVTKISELPHRPTNGPSGGLILSVVSTC